MSPALPVSPAPAPSCPTSTASPVSGPGGPGGRCRGCRGRGQAVGVAVDDHPAGGGRGEVRAEDEAAAAGERPQQVVAGGPRAVGVDVDAAADGRVRELDGVVDAVPGDEGRLAVAGELDGQVARGVAGVGAAEGRGDLGALRGEVDEVEQAGLLHGVDGVAEHLAARFVHVLAGPELALGAGDEVAGAGEGGDPRPVSVGAGVPADVVGVQVGEDDEVDGGRRVPGGGQPVEVVGVEVVPGRVGPGLAVADAGVDEDVQAGDGEGEGVTVEQGPAVVVGEVGVQPLLPADEVGGGVREEPGPGLGRKQHLVDAVDGDVADGPRGSGGWCGVLPVVGRAEHGPVCPSWGVVQAAGVRVGGGGRPAVAGAGVRGAASWLKL